jgi:hypothetical protein
MNDEQTIDRLRAALDEVVAGAPASDGLHVTVPVAARRRVGARVLVGAAAVLAVVAVTGWLVVRRDAEPLTPVATDTSTPTTVPATTIPVATNFFAIVSPDLFPGEIDHRPCCGSLPPQPQVVMAWAANGDPFVGDARGGLLTLTELPAGMSIEPEVTAYDRSLDGATLRFRSFGLTTVAMRALADQVVPGSGLPYVLPDPSMQLVALGTAGVGERRTQEYRNDAGVVTLSVGDYQGELDALTYPEPPNAVTAVEIAGNPGYRVDLFNGSVLLLWRVAATGQWGSVSIPPALAHRADGIAAAIVASPVPVGDTTTTTTTVATTVPTDALSTDPAEYASALVRAWERGDETAAGLLATDGAVQVLFSREGGGAGTWSLRGCEGAAGSSYCTFTAGGTPTVIVRVGNEAVSLGQPHAADEVRFEG